MAYLNAANDYPKAANTMVSTRQTAFDALASGVSEVKMIEGRLYSLMDRLVGSALEEAEVARPPREPGLLGDVGEAGRDLARVADAMSRYLNAIERSLP